MTQYAIRYQRSGDIRRVKRTAEGRKRRFTLRAAKHFVRRNRSRLPNVEIVPFREPR